MTTTETVEFQSAAKRALDAEAPALRQKIANERAHAEITAGQRSAAANREALAPVDLAHPAKATAAELREAWVAYSVRTLPESKRLHELERAVHDQERALRAMRGAAEAADKVAAEFAAAVAAKTSAMRTARLIAERGSDLAAAALRQKAHSRLAHHLSEGADMEDAVRQVVRTIVADALGSSGEASYFGADTRTQQRASRDILRTLVRALPESERSALDYI